MRQDRWTVLWRYGASWNKMESPRWLGGYCSTKYAGVLPRVDAIFLGEALDTVHSILLPCWALNFPLVFSVSLDKTNLSKNTRYQNSPAPYSSSVAKVLARQRQGTDALLFLAVVVPQARALNHFHEDLPRISLDSTASYVVLSWPGI